MEEALATGLEAMVNALSKIIYMFLEVSPMGVKE